MDQVVELLPYPIIYCIIQTMSTVISLVRGQPSDDLRHLGIRVDPKSLLLRHARQLHVLAVQLLLHDLLQRLEHHDLCFGESERLVKFVLQLGLRALRAGSDGFRIVAVESTRGLSVVTAPISSASSITTNISAYRLGPSSS